MDGFAPGLRESVLALSETLRIVLFFVCTVGLMLQVNAARAEQESLTRPVVRAVVILSLVGTLPFWFGFTEEVFLSTANVIEDGYTEHPMRAAIMIRESTADADHSFSLRRVGESIYKATFWAAAKLLIVLGTLVQLPFLLMQHFLKLLCYLFLPVALGLFMLPSQASLATRYLQQTLAVLSWPVGFAVTELIAYHLLTAYSSHIAVAYGLAPGEIDATSYASLISGLLGALWLVIGTVATPFLMQALFCSGSPFGGGAQSALYQIYQIHQIARLAASVKTGGAAAIATAAPATRPPSSGGGTPPAGGSPRPPAPPPPAAAGGGLAIEDPAGDRRARTALSRGLVPAAHTTI